ncbi:MAG TPA: MarR family transcriptional regulator [Gaiellaceae bacterium]|nr:MarR family transcriptional regulator [Gaiellaceae bacterium]
MESVQTANRTFTTRRSRGPSAGSYEAAAALRIGLRRLLARTEEITRAHHLTPERYELLLLIKTAPEGEATVGKLAERLSIGQSAATQLARRAENLGLIGRTVSASDARVRPLHLTEEGERRLAGAVAALEHERTAFASTLGPLVV